MANANTDNFEHYGIDQWACQYFNVNAKGELCVRFGQKLDQSIPLRLVYQELIKHNPQANPPVILHFDHILKHRIDYINQCFAIAREKHHYNGQYQLAYPVKSNPSQRITKVLAEHKGQYQNIAFEVGSKAELLAVIAQKQNKHHCKIICNGFKDTQYLILCEIAQTVGFEVIVVIEHLDEFHLIESLFSKEIALPFSIGIRLKPLSIDQHALKFGLNLAQVKQIKTYMPDCWLAQLTLIHAHHGSQIEKLNQVTSDIKRTLGIYAHLKCYFHNLNTIDLGGGLAINYGNNTSDTPDYSVETYAEEIIKTLKQHCEELSIEEPMLITESGRAIVSHCSVILTNLHYLSKNKVVTSNQIIDELKSISTDQNNLLNLFECKQYNLLLKEIFNLFYQSHISFDCYANIEEMLQLHQQTDSLQFGWLNLSVFQSLADHWGLEQAFPILPIEQLNKPCDKQLMLFDISCDKDGIIKKYVQRQHSNQNTLAVASNTLNGLFAIFLSGSYQEVLGSYHNLIGRLEVIDVKIRTDNNAVEVMTIQNESNKQILKHFGYDSDQLTSQISVALDQANTINTQVLKTQLEQILNNSPYLSDNQIDTFISKLNLLHITTPKNHNRSNDYAQSETLAC
ncbi:biosynthetic arginine decarboxylase [Thiotrichales bacterium 19S3-7]|nr:biosynthetic arginine decarboxylase [Thiotrichales bacterium 19S3-7]MCF6802734.1 biosynthetic arginine decarboxylase [Thiotrichales bacterium 19S3-11]